MSRSAFPKFLPDGLPILDDCLLLTSICAVNMCFSVSPCQVLLVFMKYDHTPGVSAHLTFKENVAYVNIKYDKSKIKMKKTNSGLAFRFSRTTKVWILCYKKCVTVTGRWNC